jgi:hypothetical protein
MGIVAHIIQGFVIPDAYVYIKRIYSFFFLSHTATSLFFRLIVLSQYSPCVYRYYQNYLRYTSFFTSPLFQSHRMVHFILIHLAVLFVLIMSSTDVDAAVMQQKNMDPYATIYIFSGRPNPRWQLSLEEWQQLNQLIESLPKLTENTIGPYQFKGNLGYTGFYAYFSIVSSYPDIYYVANKQQAVLSNPGGHLIFIDQQKLIEKWFIDSAKNHGIQLPLPI